MVRRPTVKPAMAVTGEAVPAVVTLGASASLHQPLCHWPSCIDRGWRSSRRAARRQLRLEHLDLRIPLVEQFVEIETIPRVLETVAFEVKADQELVGHQMGRVFIDHRFQNHCGIFHPARLEKESPIGDPRRDMVRMQPQSLFENGGALLEPALSTVLFG